MVCKRIFMELFGLQLFIENECKVDLIFQLPYEGTGQYHSRGRTL